MQTTRRRQDIAAEHLLQNVMVITVRMEKLRAAISNLSSSTTSSRDKSVSKASWSSSSVDAQFIPCVAASAFLTTTLCMPSNEKLQSNSASAPLLAASAPLVHTSRTRAHTHTHTLKRWVYHSTRT
eukprot:5507007-Amphidinium_carterae.1